MFNVRLAGGHLYGKQLFTWLSLVVSLIASFVLSLFPLDVLDEIWDLIELVSEGFLTCFCQEMKTETKLLQRAETLLPQGKLKMTKVITRKLKPVHEAQHMFNTKHIVNIANVRVTPSKTVTFVNTMAGMQVIKEHSQTRLMQLLLRQIANVKLYQLLQSPLPMTTKVTNVVINSTKMLHTM